ncbi:hypothetical protein M758_9G101200 [Ceratodon purpureus]|nr:hypothetical protein M758_9G101200 [Ceratodon purpureus]
MLWNVRSGSRNMAFIDAAVAVTASLVKISSLANETRDNIEENWYQASKDMEEFIDLEKKLNRKSKDWSDALRSAGMSDDIRITEPLNEAIQCLEREKKKMDTVQSNCCIYRFKFMFIFRAQPFPSNVKDSMKKLVDAFDYIPNAYGDRAEAAMILEPLANNRLEPYQITVDPRTVKLAETQDKVMQCLEDKMGNQVVTLHGGPGLGKTCLAQLVTQHYQADENRSIFADGARFLSCGHNATVDSICKKLFQTLGISDMNTDSAPDAKAEHEAFKSKAATSASEGQSSLVKKLPRRLKERHLLIILDDVSDPELLKDNLIVPQARNVKYLITTQIKNVCDGATLIRMEKPNMGEAMKILGKHIPNLIDGVILDHLQDKAIQIIEKADRHPMTLATIGVQIDEFDSWDEVLNNFNDMLASSEQEVLAFSLRMAVDALKDKPDAQKLLFLVAMCEPLLVPEVVLQLLFRHGNPEYVDSHQHFAFKMHGIRKTLKDRDLISVKEKDWNLSQTYQYFILKHKKDDVSELLHALLTKKTNDDDDHELVKALCVLYVGCKRSVLFTTLAAKALEDAEKEFNISMEDQDMILNMREAIEPLIYMLFPSKEGEECETRRHRLVSKAIKRFISRQDLDDESFAQLLMEEDIYEDICEVLKKMTTVRDSGPLLTEDKTLIMEELRFNLDPSSKEVVTTLDTLSQLAHAANCDFILTDDRVLINLLKILRTSHDRNEIMDSTLTCLSALAQSSTAREKIASSKGLIEAVVTIFNTESDITQESNIMVKVDSIAALGSIALQETTSTKLVKTPGLLASIAQFLEDIYSKEREFILAMGHYGAIPTIQCLLSLLKGNDSNKDEISKHEDLMGMVTKIFEVYNGDTASNFSYSGDEVAQVALQVLTLIDPEKYNNVPLHSVDAYIARGHSNAYCGRYMEAFDDYKRADRIDKSNDIFYKSKLCFFKAMLKDYKGALAYARFALETQPNDPFLLQEIGVVKELMKDYEAAKIDYTKLLALNPNDYEVLKHRAYVNSMLGCDEEAHEDAKKALEVIPKYRVDKRDTGQAGYLGALSVPPFLDYDLK